MKTCNRFLPTGDSYTGRHGVFVGSVNAAEPLVPPRHLLVALPASGVALGSRERLWRHRLGEGVNVGRTTEIEDHVAESDVSPEGQV
jgi:hypothetical protein